jgi:DnaK suppressor protein
VTQTERRRIRDELLELARRLNADVEGLTAETLQARGGEASGSLSNAPMHPADLGTDAFEQEVSLGLLENQTGMLGALAEAFRRVDAGTYGRCERCGQPVGKERLKAVPLTPYCFACAQAVEREEAG